MLEAIPNHAELSGASDEELMEGIMQKDEASFTELTCRYSRALCMYLRQYVGNADDADEVLQEVFLNVWSKSDKFKQGNRVRPWLYSIATHKAVDLQRKMKHRTSRPSVTDQLDEEGNPVDVFDLIPEACSVKTSDFPDSMMEEVRTAVGKLPPLISPAMKMAYWQDLKYREIAEVLEIPVGTVKSRLNRGLQLLQDTVQTAL